MNLSLQQLKIILEIEKTHSLTKAAENLYISQPNLSRRIRELEDELGYHLFQRTSRGMTPTPLGLEAIRRAKSAVVQLEAIKNLGRDSKSGTLTCRIAVPKGSYLCFALIDFLAETDSEMPLEVEYMESSANKAMEQVLIKQYDFAVLQYRAPNEAAFLPVITENGLHAQTLMEYQYRVLVSESSSLARREEVPLCELKYLTEVVSNTPFVPTVTHGDSTKLEIPTTGRRRIYLNSRDAQYEFLCCMPSTYMWSPPVPDCVLKKHGLKLLNCIEADSTWLHKELLVYRRDLRHTQPRDRLISCIVTFCANQK